MLKMNFNGAVLTFKVTYTCPEYVFCECPEKPEARGFFTNEFVKRNTVD